MIGLILGALGLVGVVLGSLGHSIPNFPLWVWIVILTIGLLLAPFQLYKKQTEEIKRLSKPKVMPLQNRKELIEAIVSFENTTLKLIEHQDVVNLLSIETAHPQLAALSLAQANRNKAHIPWKKSLDKLRTQYLVAGEAYERIVDDFIDCMVVQVTSKRRKENVSKDIQPDAPIYTAGVLRKRAKETIQKINELSGQAPDGEDSQS